MGTDYYLSRGTGKVIIKLGDSGSALFQRSATGASREVVVPSFKVNVVDTVGAGDGFASGVLTALIEGLDDEALLERANAVGAIQLLSSLFDQSVHLVLDGLCLMLSRRDQTSDEDAQARHANVE